MCIIITVKVNPLSETMVKIDNEIKLSFILFAYIFIFIN